MQAYTSNTHIIKKRGKRGGRRVKARISRQLEAAYISLYTALEKHKFNNVIRELENTIHHPPYIITKSDRKAYFIWYAIARNIGSEKYKFNILIGELENTIRQPPYLGIKKSEEKAYFIWYAIARNIGMSKSEIETEQKYFYIYDYDPEEELRDIEEEKERQAMYREEEKYGRWRHDMGNGDDPELLRAMARFYGN